MQSDIVATSGAYTYGFARFSAELPRTLFLFVDTPRCAIAYTYPAAHGNNRGRLYTGSVRLLDYAPWRLLAARAHFAPSRGRVDSTRGCGDVRQDRARGMVRHLSLRLSPQFSRARR